MAARMREYILGVAGDLFSKQGINATSVDKIVAQAQVAKVTLYNHFKTKELLVIEYLRDHNEKFWNKISASPQKDDALEELGDFVTTILDYIGDKDFKGFASINAAVEFPEIDHVVNQTSKEFSKQLRTKLVEMGIRAGIKNPEVLALQLQLIIEGASIANHSETSQETIEHAKSMASILIKSSS